MSDTITLSTKDGTRMSDEGDRPNSAVSGANPHENIVVKMEKDDSLFVYDGIISNGSFSVNENKNNQDASCYDKVGE